MSNIDPVPFTDSLAAIRFYNEDYLYQYRYPYPLAQLYRRHATAHNPVDRVGFLLATAEASLKFLVAVTLGVSNAVTLDDVQSMSRPTFGTWLNVLRHLTRDLQSQAAAESFICVHLAELGTGPYLDAIAEVIEERNAFVHGAALTAEQAGVLLEIVQPPFARAFRELSFLADCPFVYCEDVRRVRRPACFEAVVRRCQGCNPVFPYELWRLNATVEPDVALLAEPDLSVAYPLHPLVARIGAALNADFCFFLGQKKTHARWHRYESRANEILMGNDDLQADMAELLAGNPSVSRMVLDFLPSAKPAIGPPALGASEGPDGYDVIGEIGEGRFATVHRVLHRGLHDMRAMKLLRPDVALDPRLRQRFEAEAQSLARLRGTKSAIEVFEYSETKRGVPYLIVELAEEGSLDESMRGGAKHWRDVAAIGIDCFNALATIHHAGLVHRDIKLSNILVKDGSHVFCDFGSTKILEAELQMTLATDVLGTVRYAPPELIRGETDARSDLYSLGVCLVNLLAGEVTSDSRAWLQDSYDGPEPFRKTLFGLLEPLPANRPPSASAVSTRIREIVATEEDRHVDDSAISFGALEANPVSLRPQTTFWKAPDGTLFREIPAGEFLMGGTKYADERPVHRVGFTEPFFMAQTLVTNAQFLEFCRKTKYALGDRRFLMHISQRSFDSRWKRPECPVVFVSWDDANEYVLWRCETDDRDYHLPTEAQWEYACRAGTRTVYPWGNTYDRSLLNADNTQGCPTPVGTYPPNAWGLFDMLGNVWEWTEDVKDVIPKEESLFFRLCAETPGGIAVDPVNSGTHARVSTRVDPDLRAVRGGSWFSDGRNHRPANRRGQRQSERARAVGFRLVARGLEIADLTQIPDLEA